MDLCSVNNRQQKTLILESCSVCVPVDECEVTSDPRYEEDSERADRQPAEDTDNIDVWRKNISLTVTQTLLTPLPVSCFRLGGTNLNHVFQLLSRFYPRILTVTSWC